MRAPFSDLAKELFASAESVAQLRKFLGTNDQQINITVKDERGLQKVVRVEKLNDIATTRNL